MSTFEVFSQENQGPTTITITTPGDTFGQTLDLNHVPGGSGNPDAVRIAEVYLQPTAFRVTSAPGEGTWWNANLTVNAAGPTIDINITKPFGGTVQIKTPNDSFLMAANQNNVNKTLNV